METHWPVIATGILVAVVISIAADLLQTWSTTRMRPRNHYGRRCLGVAPDTCWSGSAASAGLVAHVP